MTVSQIIHATAHVADMIRQAQIKAELANEQGDHDSENYYRSELIKLQALLSNWRGK